MATKIKKTTGTVNIGTEQPAISFDQMINSNTVVKTAATTKKKNSAPVIKLPENLVGNLKKFLDAKAAKKLAESTMGTEEPVLIEYCRKTQDKDGFAGNYSNSYDVAVGETITAKLVTMDKFKVQAEPEQINVLKAKLGDNFNTIIKMKTVPFVLKTDLTDEQKKKLASLVGASYAEFFETRTEYTTVENFDERIYEIAGNETKLGEIRELITQSKPYIK